MLTFDRPKITDAGANICSDHVGVRVVDHEPAVFDGFIGRSQGKVSKPAHPPRFLLFKKAKRIETFNLARELDRKPLRIEPADVVGTALTVHHGAPSRRHIVTARRNQTEPCNYYSTFHKKPWPVDSGQ